MFSVSAMDKLVCVLGFVLFCFPTLWYRSPHCVVGKHTQKASLPLAHSFRGWGEVVLAEPS